MKNLLNNAFMCVIVMTTCFNCSVESIENDLVEQSLTETPQLQLDPCSNQDPQARITNNGTVAVTLQIATIDGTILHTITDLAPGDVSGYLTFAADDIIFNVSKNTTGITDEKVVHVMDQCMSFDMEVDTDNYLIDSIPVNL